MSDSTVIKLNNGSTIKIIRDESPGNPREDYDNPTQMICFHRRYNLGDKHEMRHEDYNGWAEVEAAIKEEHNVAIIKPLYLMDHSGLAISTGSFNDRWDSGQIGFIFVTTEELKANWPYEGETVPDEIKKKGEAWIESDLETYGLYLSGDAWGFVIKGPGGEEVDSCWGFWGSDVEKSGMADHWSDDIREEAVAKAQGKLPNKMTPQFKHDRDCCTFLGRYEKHDLYYCASERPWGTLIARHGDNPADYGSGLPFAFANPLLMEALLRAAERHLLTEETRKKVLQMVAEQRETLKGGNSHATS